MIVVKRVNDLGHLLFAGKARVLGSKKAVMKKILMLTDFSKNADHAAKAVAKVVPHSGLFGRSTTAAALDNQHLPLMVIPSAQTHAG